MSGTERTHPHLAVIMGVSGSGKSTVAEALAAQLGWELLEGDDLHPAANIAKMAAGHPLTDADREPWLEAIAAWIAQRVDAGESGLVTCSALKRSYRDILRAPMIRHPEAELTFVLLTGSRELLLQRMTERPGHFMPASLLDSQLATLEPPGPDENSVTVEIGPPPAEVAAAARKALGLGT